MVRAKKMMLRLMMLPPRVPGRMALKAAAAAAPLETKLSRPPGMV
ncbi:hypothetical protein EVA_12954 [gut metagenome]|uniref:Uncharacterized protein n=1 Tax=gut metagenome TaxID=749906 RepID=J9FWM6_9ZZZZ